MKQHAERFTPAALTLSIVTAALADGIPQSVPVRRALWLGAVSTVCLCVLSAPDLHGSDAPALLPPLFHKINPIKRRQNQQRQYAVR